MRLAEASLLLWLAVFGGASVLLTFLGLLARAQREPDDLGVDPVHLARQLAIEPTSSDPTAVAELAAHATVTEMAARRAVAAAEHALQQADAAAAARDEAARLYQQAEQRFVAEPDEHRLLQRAALSAYQRGDLSVDQLNRIWAHGATSGSATVIAYQSGKPEDDRVRQARHAYEDAVNEAQQARRAARIAEVAAKALADEALLATIEAQAARRSAHRRVLPRFTPAPTDAVEEKRAGDAE